MLFENVTKNRFFADERDKFAVILNAALDLRLRRSLAFVAFAAFFCVLRAYTYVVLRLLAYYERSQTQGRERVV